MKIKTKYYMFISLLFAFTIFFAYVTHNTYKDYTVEEYTIDVENVFYPENNYARFYFFNTLTRSTNFELYFDSVIPINVMAVESIVLLDGDTILGNASVTDYVPGMFGQVTEYGSDETLYFKVEEYIPYFDHVLLKTKNSDYLVYYGPTYLEEIDLEVSTSNTSDFLVSPTTPEDLEVNEGRQFYRLPQGYALNYKAPSDLSTLNISLVFEMKEFSAQNFIIKEQTLYDWEAITSAGIDGVIYEKLGVLTNTLGVKQITSSEFVYILE